MKCLENLSFETLQANTVWTLERCIHWQYAKESEEEIDETETAQFSSAEPAYKELEEETEIEERAGESAGAESQGNHKESSNMQTTERATSAIPGFDGKTYY